MKEKKDSMGFILLAIAPLFLFNPDLAVIDVLPDFIGYILIAAALTKLSFICPQIETSRTWFWRAAIVGIAKTASIFFLFGISSQNERPVAILLSTFSFAVVELILLVPAWGRLWDGLLYLGSRTGAMAPYSSRRGRATVTGVAKGATVFFIFFKPLCAVLPEFASLSMGGYDDSSFNWYEFIGLFREIGIMLALIAGIAWLVFIERYFAFLRKDGEFIPTLRKKYDDEILPGDIRFTKRRINIAFALLAAAFFLEIDLLLESNNIIPDVLAALCFVGFFVTIAKLYPQWKIGAGVSAVYTVAAGVNEWLEFSFNNKYFNASVWQHSEVLEAFLVRYASVIVSSVLFAAVAVIACRAQRVIIHDHAGFIAENSSREFRDAKLGEIRRYLGRWVTSVTVMSVVCTVSFCIGDAIVTLNSSIYDRLGVVSGAARTLSDVWWIISAVLCLVNFILVLKTESEIKAEVDSRYMLG